MAARDGGPAFGHGNPEQGGDPGMTLHQYFAAAALTATMKAPPSESRQVGWQKSMAWDACSIADAMVAEYERRAKENGDG